MGKGFVAVIVLFLTADAALMAYLFYAGRAPTWVTGRPLNWFAELALLVGVFGAPGLLVGAVHAVCKRLGNRWPRALPDWGLYAAVALVFFTVYLVAILPSPVLRVKGKPREWLYDSWLGIRVPHGFTGHLISGEPYNLELELENRTSEPLYVSQITVKRFSKEAAKLFRRTNDLVHVGEDHRILYLNSREQTKVTIMGNEILPDRLELEIHHSLSDRASFFEVDVAGGQLAVPAARRLPSDVIFRGMDGLAAVERARRKAEERDRTGLSLVAAMPGDHATYLDPKSRLKTVAVKSWIVTLCSGTNKRCAFVVTEDEVTAREFAAPEACEPVPFPRLGNQAVLALANEHDLLCLDWRNLRLIGCRTVGTLTCAWHLPYIGPDGLPLIIDAVSGHRLRPSTAADSDTFEFAESLVAGSDRAEEQVQAKKSHSRPALMAPRGPTVVARPQLGPTTLPEKGRKILVYKTELFQRPPFYEGAMPFVYIEGKQPLGIGDMAIVYHEFAGWRNWFVYADARALLSRTAGGARTVDSAGRVLAEAKVVQTLAQGELEVEEFHYNERGEIGFHCRSRYDSPFGFKRTEQDATGRKECEYYLIWPTGGL